MSCLDAEVDDERVVLDDLDKDLQSDAPNSQTTLRRCIGSPMALKMSKKGLMSEIYWVLSALYPRSIFWQKMFKAAVFVWKEF